MADCTDPNIPAVDNTALDCAELITTDCIVTSEAQPYLKYGVNKPITAVFRLITKAIKRIDLSLKDYLPTYKSYVVTLQQAGALDPVATAVMESRLDITPVYSRTSAGEYTLTATGAFPLGKTLVIVPSIRNTVVAGAVTNVDNFSAERIDVNTISVTTTQKTGVTPIVVDGLLNGTTTTLEIRVYN